MSTDRFHPVTIGQRGLFEAALSVQARWSCECNFVNVFAWAEVYDTVHTAVAGRRIVCNRRVGKLLFPFGEWFVPETLEAVRVELSAHAVFPLAWGDVPREYVEAHAPALHALYDVDTTPDEDDYVLRAADVAALAGRDHQNTRRLIRQFGERVPGWRVAPITRDNLQTVRELAVRLLVTKGLSAFTDDEAKALHRACDHFEALGLEGLVLTAADATPLAFSLFSFTTPDVCNVHFEKADRQTTGAAQAMRVSVARHLAGRCAWLNIEQDMGDPGLRRSKRSYLPERLLPRYRLTPRTEAPR